MGLKSKRGFTLAEVLITLGIIGVIASLTIPLLLKNQEEKELRVAWKKAYSVVSQAYLSAINENGGQIGAGRCVWPDYIERVQKFKDQLKVTKECVTNSGIALGNCWAREGVGPDSSLMSCGGGEASLQLDRQKNLWSFATADGMYFAVWHGCSQVYIDVNGNRGPNTWGKDVHGLTLNDTKITSLGICLSTDQSAIDYLLDK